MANFNYNKVILGGRLTADPELKTTTTGTSVCNFTVAVNRKVARDEERKADFITCTAWRKTAEFIASYFHKGDSIVVEGGLQVRSWEKDGKKHYATEVIVNEATFVDGKNEKPSVIEPQFEDITDEEFLPF
jgi:single-strand DNA-binding protein